MREEETRVFANEIDKASVLLKFGVEAEKKPLDKRKLAAFGTIFVGVVVYFALTNNYLAALLFWLAGVMTGFSLYEKNKNPKNTICKLRTEGVQVNNDLYPYETLKSFWIFYDPPRHQELSLRSKAPLAGGYIKIPIGDEDPVQIREILLRFLPEEKQEEGFVDVLARMAGL